MTELTYYLKVALEGIDTVIFITLALIVYFRSRKNLPNIFMATAFLLFGTFIGSLLIYDVFAQDSTGDIFIAIFLRLGLISMLFGGMCLYFAMMGQAHSRMWYTFKKNTWPWIGIVTAYSLFLIIWNRGLFSSDWILWDDVKYRPVDANQVVYVLIPMIALLFIFLISSTVVLYNYGVKKTEGLRKRNMQRFLSGVIVGIIAVSINVVGQIFGETSLGAISLSEILDLVFSAVLALSVIVLFSGLAFRSKSKHPVVKVEEEGDSPQ